MRHKRGSFRGAPRGAPRGGFRGGFRGRGAPPTRPYNLYNLQNNANRGKKWESPGKRLSEEEIGVTEYISVHPGFDGIIKSRYSDFQVSEINLKGEVAKLTNLEVPLPPKDSPVDQDEELFNKYNVEILPNEMWDRINNLVTGKGSEESVQIDVTTASKEERTKIHEAVKKAFGKAVVGSTVTVDDKKYIKFVKYKRGVRVDKRVKWPFPGEFVHFIVHKENCDTLEAANKIAEGLRNHIKPSNLGYAGTKDKRGKTSQWFSVKKILPANIVAAVKHMREIHVGNFSFSNEVLKLGMLKGNRFRIALRNVTASEETISQACDALKTDGFINYYGLQRFGSTVKVPTYVVGKCLLRGDYRTALNRILEQSECSAGGYNRKTLQERIQDSLYRYPNDLLLALSQVPRNTRLLYLHSYQSLIWNRCVTERIKRFGLKPAVGDFVLKNKQDLVETEIKEDPDSDSEEATEDIKQDTADTEPNKIQVKSLTEEDIASDNYTIFDVIMPLPGSDVEYPPNMVEFYKKLLMEDELTLTMKQNKHKNYCLSGAYRQMVVVPGHLEWRLVNYSDPYADLIRSDLDELEDREVNGIVPDGKYTALLLNLDLPSSSYATMALRELLKVDTSSYAQAQGNNYHKKNEIVQPKDAIDPSKNATNSSKDAIDPSKDVIEQSNDVIGVSGHTKDDQNDKVIDQSENVIGESNSNKRSLEESDVGCKRSKTE